LSSPELIPLLSMSEESFRNRFRNSPIKRAKLIGLKRNVCVALGNIGNPIAVPTLITILNSSEPLLRLHAAWALGKIGGEITQKMLISALRTERDDSVLEEIHLSLKDMSEC
jgi:epoxyqueuosine reductase